jgi:hypothetical protein
MTDLKTKPTRRLPNIGFTFEEVGTKRLPTGQEVPVFKGKPNDIEAHRRVIEWVEKDVGKSPG